MSCRGIRASIFLLICCGALALLSGAQAPSSSSSSPKHIKKPATENSSEMDAGAVVGSVYHNKTLALSCKIPAGWVLRTEEMTARQEDGAAKQPEPSPVGEPR